MYSVSEAFMTALHDPHRVEHVRGTVGTVDFVDNNIISMNYQNQCSDNKDVTLGSARIGQLNVVFTGMNISRGAWRGKTITLEWGVELADHTTEYIPVGVFTIAKADWTETGISVVAYDCLSKLDNAFSISTTTGKIYDLLKLAEDLTGVPCGRTKAECEALPNGDEILGLYVQNDIKTVRDYISWVGCTVAGFTTAGRDGSLLVKSFAESEVVDSFVSRERVVGSIFSDYITQYDGINIQDVVSGTVEYYYGDGETGGVSISIGANPFLQYGTDQVKSRQRKAIANTVVGIHYTPFKIAILNAPVYDLGDLIQCGGGVAGTETLTCCVMAINWTFNKTTSLQGFGADPNLVAGKSKTDKALNGMSSKTSESTVVTHTYVNAIEYELGNHFAEPVIEIAFATVKPTIVTMNHEIVLDLDITDPSGVATATAYYYLNDELQGSTPMTSWNNDGPHLLPLIYFLDTLSGGTAYDWRVELKIDGGTATIARNDIHAWLTGQGLVAVDQFAGTIHVEDEYDPIVLDKRIVDFIDTVVNLDITAIDVDFGTITDIMDVYGIGRRNIVEMEDSCSLQFAFVQFNIIDETGDFNITDESGVYRIVSEGGFDD